MKKNIQNEKQRAIEEIFATIVVFFMAVMITGSIEISNSEAANATNTSLIQNLTAGSLQLEAPSSATFNNVSVAVPANSLANLSVVNIRDYQGTGAGWSVTGMMNNLTTGASGTNTISNAVIAWAPGAVFALDGASNTGVSIGSAGYFSSARTLVSASAGNGQGNYRLNGTMLNVVYNGRADQMTGTYQNILTLTIN